MQTLVATLGLTALGVAFAFVDCKGPPSNESSPIGASVSAMATSRSAVLAGQPLRERALPRRPPPDLNVLLLTIDSLRSDMPWNGYPRPIAPRLTALEKQAVSYGNAYALSSYTSMSLGGLLGGRYPGEMNRDGYFFGTYRDNVMFPKVLQSAGIRTIAIHGHMYFRRGASGFEHGFDVYEVVPGLNWDPTTDPNITGEKMEKMAERLLGDPANTTGRFFAWLHLMDPHDEYRSHPEVPAWGKKGRDRYDGEVTYTDLQVEKLLDFVGKQAWAERTAIIVSADHGEVFGEHGLYRHGFELWQPLVHVPWFFVLPQIPGRRIEVARSHLDFAPTILDLFGLPAEPVFEGQSLVPELYGTADPEERDIVVDLPRTSDSDRRRALIHGRHKIIGFRDDEEFQVFDLEKDPDEQVSLAKSDPATFDDMLTRYKAVTRRMHDVGPYACRKLKGAPEGRGY